MSKQDQIVDDDEPETCPLCIEELDASDRKFRPCPCGYQICQFCYNHLKTQLNNMCPACRRPYDDKDIKWEAPSAEDVAKQKEFKAQQEKKKAAAKRQEAATRHADSLSRKHLAGIRVRRQNLVYVTGLRLNTSEPHLSEILRGPQFFGQYGKIDKIVVNKPKDSRSYQHVGVYVTFFEKEAAALCIETLNGSQNSGGTVRADYGTTKYCSAFLRNEVCTNKNCTFLHEVGEENESFTRAGLSSLNAKSSQSAPESSSPQHQAAQSSHSQSTQSQTPTHPTPSQQTSTQTAPSQLSNSQQTSEQPATGQATSQPMERHDSLEASSPVESSDGSALPSSASWAREPVSRRPSQTQSFASGSPAASLANPMPAVTESPTQEGSDEANTTTGQQSSSSSSQEAQRSRYLGDADMDKLLNTLASPDFGFVFDDSSINSQDGDLLKNLPLMFDPDGGAKRLMRRQHDTERSIEEKDKQVAFQALSAMENDVNAPGGSLQLGGEPDERPDLDLHQSQLRGAAANPAFRLDRASPSNQLLVSQSPVSKQQQYLTQQLKSNSPGLMGSSQRAPGEYYQNSSSVTHSRQASRFSFANDTGATTSVKPVTNQKLMNQQSSMMPANQGNQYNLLSQQNQGGTQLFSSGVQGPPPGLKATGTPPVSGGGMFGQGHGFATAGLGYGVNSTSRNSNDEMMRELLRNRGSSAGGGQTPDTGRREYNLSSFSHQNPSPAPNPGLSSFPYGSHPGAFQEHSQQKQKKKSKKQRHANTSSSGGGVVDLADPSILQARMHQTGSGAQGQYGAQGQGQEFSGTTTQADSANQQAPLATYSLPRAADYTGEEHWHGPTPAPPPGLSSAPRQVQNVGQGELFAGKAVSKHEDLPLMPGLGVLPAQLQPQLQPQSTQSRQSSVSEPHRKQNGRLQETPMDSVSQPSAMPPVNEDAAFPALPKATPAKVPDVAKSKVSKPAEKVSTAESKKREPVADKKPDPTVTSTKETKTITTEAKPSKQPKQRQHPGKLDIPAAATSETTESLSEATMTSLASSQKGETPVAAPVEPSSTSAANSRPATPSQSSETPLRRSAQPRTIRVLPTPKSEVPGLSSNASTPPPQQPEAASSASRAQGSRRPSVASLSVPETPASDKIADNMSATTESVSRASSPPPEGSDVVSGKGKSKRQKKKEEAEKAKAEGEAEKKTSAEGATHEPVIGRKKKAKKPAAVSTLTSTPEVSRPPSAAGQNKQAEVPETELPQETVSSTPIPTVTETVQEQDNGVQEAESEPKVSKDPRPLPANIISQLKSSELVDPNGLDFFRANQNLFSNSRHEVIPADLLNTKPIAPLTQTELEILDAGRPVRRTGSDNRTSSRFLITPSRKCLPRMPADKEDRYLDLEKAVYESKAPYRYIHQRKDKSQQLVSADDVLKDMCATLTRPPTTTTVSASSAGAASASSETNGNVPDSATVSAEEAAASAVAAATSSYGDDALAYLNHFILPPLPNRNAAAAASAATNGADTIDSSRPVAAALSRYFAADPDATLNSLGQSLSSLAGVGANEMPGALDGNTAALAASPEAITQALANAVNGVVQAAAAVTGVSPAELGMRSGGIGSGTGIGETPILGRVMNVEEAEQALNAARKENESIEKRMAALVRKNRRVAGMT